MTKHHSCPILLDMSHEKNYEVFFLYLFVCFLRLGFRAI